MRSGPTQIVLLAVLSAVGSGCVEHDSFQLFAESPSERAYFGKHVGVSGDTVVLAGNAVAEVFERRGERWSRQQVLTVPLFHRISAIAVSGDTILLGVMPDGVAGAGYVAEFARDGRRWTEQQSVVRVDPQGGARSGWRLALEGDTAVVSRRFVGPTGSLIGSVTVYERTGTTWAEQGQLPPGDVPPGTVFGAGVALSGDSAIVGTDWDGSGDFVGPSGGAQVFTREAGVWSLQQRLSGMAQEEFGENVGISGDTAIAVGWSARLFIRTNDTWASQDRVEVSSGSSLSVLVSGDTALVGSPDYGSSAGSVYVFAREDDEWSEERELTAPDRASQDHFGQALAMSGDTVVVGAPLRDSVPLMDAGSAYVFDLQALREGGDAP